MGQAGTGSSGDRSHRRHTPRRPMAESGQPLLPAPAWQAITQTTQPRDSQWQVAERRYLSEGSMAKLTQNGDDAARPKEVRRATAELVGT